MLLVVIIIFVCTTVGSDEVARDSRPVVLPIPLEFPNRNDRADQCWLRVEDVELTHLMATLCDMAKAFLKNHIRDYNSRKLTEDGVELTLVTEAPKVTDEVLVPYTGFNGQRTVKDWRSTTFLDPTTSNLIYVSAKADCRLIMYSRDGQTNYKVNCEKILYFMNEKMKNGSVAKRASLIVFAIVFLVVNLCL